MGICEDNIAKPINCEQERGFFFIKPCAHPPNWQEGEVAAFYAAKNKAAKWLAA